METVEVTPAFWSGRRVLLTGHTGFKGAWLALWLESLGADITAFALPPATTPALIDLLTPWRGARLIHADLRDRSAVCDIVAEARPEIVFHLAAQALVRPSYADPAGTFASNVAGSVHLLEALRQQSGVRAILVVTSDKVYANDGSGRPFREDDPLGGKDPYSASKACQDVVAASYRESFFRGAGVALGVARAGNVIGGGDWAVDRLVPDFVRAATRGEPLHIRHPDATRPWQHVLEPLHGYLMYAEALACRPDDVQPVLNFGPPPEDVRSVRRIVESLSTLWGHGAGWSVEEGAKLAEARALSLDATAAQDSLGWRPRLHLDDALAWTVSWYRAHAEDASVRALSLAQIRRYGELAP